MLMAPSPLLLRLSYPFSGHFRQRPRPVSRKYRGALLDTKDSLNVHTLRKLLLLYFPCMCESNKSCPSLFLATVLALLQLKAHVGAYLYELLLTTPHTQKMGYMLHSVKLTTNI